MSTKMHAFAIAAITVGLTALACSASTQQGSETAKAGPEVTTGAALTTTAATVSSPTAASTTSTTPAPTADVGALKDLVPTPTDTKQTFGPDSIAGEGMHWKFAVDGPPSGVMTAYKKALESQGWTVTTIVSSSGQGGGGATYTGTHGAAYGVFDGGGFSNSTFVNVCAWPAKPSEPNCSRGS